MLRKNARLRSRWIIFRQTRDFFEQLAAARVVKIAARQRLARLRQTLDDRQREFIFDASEIASTSRQCLSRTHHSISEAKRRPRNCQRW